jgi:hypothetical protein
MKKALFAMTLAAILTQRVPATRSNCDFVQTHLDLGKKDPQILNDVERRWIQAYGEGDTRSLTCILADDFEIGSAPDAKLEVNNKQHVLDWVSTKSHSVNNIERLEIKAFGQAAITRGIYSVCSQDGKRLSRFQFTDVFLYRRTGWQAVSRQISELPLQ